MDVFILQIQEQILKVAKVTPQERVSEKLVRVVGVRIPYVMEEIIVVVMFPHHERVQQRTVEETRTF